MASVTNGINPSNGGSGPDSAFSSNPIDSWSKEKKLVKLANYSACQTLDCKCFGYKVALSPFWTPYPG